MAQKTLISIITAVAAELNLPPPTTVVSSQDQNVQKLLTLARAVCDDLLSEFDWQNLQTRYSFSTVSGQDTYPFPTDRDRFISGTFFDSNNRWPLQGPSTPTEWEWMKASNIKSPFSSFRVFGDKIAIAPTPGTSIVRSGPENSVSRLSGCFASQFRLKSRTREQGHDQENET